MIFVSDRELSIMVSMLMWNTITQVSTQRGQPSLEAMVKDNTKKMMQLGNGV